MSTQRTPRHDRIVAAIRAELTRQAMHGAVGTVYFDGMADVHGRLDIDALAAAVAGVCDAPTPPVRSFGQGAAGLFFLAPIGAEWVERLLT